MSRQFVVIPAAAFFDTALTPMQIKVLGALGYHTDRSGWCWPGMARMAELIGCTHSAVSKAVTVLEAAGYIEVARNKRKGNRYHVITRYNVPDGPPLSADVPAGTTDPDVPPDGTSVVPPKRNKNENSNGNNSYRQTAFEKFWFAYPNKKAKGAAEKAFEKALATTDLDTILIGVETYKANKDDRIDYCHPSTWLNQQRWSDEYDDRDNRNHHPRRAKSSNDYFFDAVAERLEAGAGQDERPMDPEP
jgi:hypothetical protein